MGEDNKEVVALLVEYNMLKDNVLREQARMTQIRRELEQRGMGGLPESGDLFGGPRRKVALRDLRNLIIRTLEKEQHVMTSPQLAAALWKEEYGISIDKMTRRVIVTASAMYKETTPPRLLDSGEKEGSAIYWCIPSWKEGDRLKPQYLPPGHKQ